MLQNENEYPLVSVVMATYNGSRFISEQLDSIVNQTYPNIEIVITDDNSTDGSYAVLQEYAEKYSNIRLYKNETNLHYVKNFEKGMLLSTGDYIAPSDQDDIWELDKISILIEAIGDNAIIYCNSVLIDENGKEMGRKLSDIKQLIHFDSPLNFAIGNAAPGHAMLIQRQVLMDSVPFPTMIPHDHTLGFVASFYSRVYFFDRLLVKYRQHSANVFGAAKVADASEMKQAPKPRVSKKDIHANARERMKWLYEKCPRDLVFEKKVFGKLLESYQDFSFKNNCKRMITFFRNNKAIMAFKRRSLLRRWLFCLKMFVKIE